MTTSSYTLYGLSIRSALELPEVRTRTGNVPHDVEIVEGPVPERLAVADTLYGYMDYTEHKCLYRIPDVGRFLVEHGQRLTVDREPGADARDVRAFLFGSIFGTLLHQRKLIPLHVSGVATPSGVVAFTGEPGAGKSTLAATLHKLYGWPIFCDDVAVLREIRGQPILEAGMLRLKLWRDALERLGHNPEAAQQDATRFDKYHLNAEQKIADGKARLVSLVQLTTDHKSALTPLSGGKAFTALMNSVYRPYLVPIFNNPEMVTQTVFRLLPTIQVFTYARPWSAADLETSAEVLWAQFGQA